MRIKNQDEILNIEVRKKIIDEILGQENQARKDEQYKRYLCLKDKAKRFVTEQLLLHFDQTTVSEMMMMISNVSLYRKVIEKLAKVYSHGVTRVVLDSEDDTAKIEELDDKLNFTSRMKEINQFLKASKNTVMYVKPCPYYDETNEIKWRPTLQPLMAYLYDAVEDYYDRTKPLVYVLSNYEQTNQRRVSQEPSKEGRTFNTPRVEPRGDAKDQAIADSKEDENADKKHFIFWSDRWHFTTDESGAVLDKNGEETSLAGDELLDFMSNPIDEMPIVNFADGQVNSFWAEGGDDLVDQSILVNSLISNYQYTGFLQGHGQIVMTGKKLPRNIKVGPNHAVLLEYEDDDPIPTFGFASPSPQLAELRQQAETAAALMLTTNNLSTSSVNTRLDQNANMAAGISLMIDKSESIEDVRDQQQIFLDNEPHIWRIINKWLQVYAESGSLDEAYQELILPEGFEQELLIKFGEPKVLLSEKEKLEIMEKKKALGLVDQVDLIMMENPDMTREDAEEKMRQIQEAKMAAMPTVFQNTNQDDEEEPEVVDESKEDDGKQQQDDE